MTSTSKKIYVKTQSMCGIYFSDGAVSIEMDTFSVQNNPTQDASLITSVKEPKRYVKKPL